MSESVRPDPPGPEDKAPLVTFFVMAYRQETLVREAIESAFAQTWPNLEIILSDDNSPDGTFRVMEEMAAAYRGPHRVILNRNRTNLGVCGHIDRIMELSSGRLIVQNAGDDVSLPERTERVVAAWRASGGRAALIHSLASLIDDDGVEFGIKRPSPEVLRNPSASTFIGGSQYILGAASAWRRDVFDVFGPLGRDLGVEDTVIPVRAAILGEIVHIDAPLVKWRAGGMSYGSREGRRGRDYLYGHRMKVVRWHARTHSRLAEDLAKVEFPGREACVAANDARRLRMDFEVALADSGTMGRLSMLPRALATGRRLRDGFFVRQWLKHLLGPVYGVYLDLRYPKERLRW